jgi:hypothetical protein
MLAGLGIVEAGRRVASAVARRVVRSPGTLVQAIAESIAGRTARHEQRQDPTLPPGAADARGLHRHLPSAPGGGDELSAQPPSAASCARATGDWAVSRFSGAPSMVGLGKRQPSLERGFEVAASHVKQVCPRSHPSRGCDPAHNPDPK